MTPIRIHPAQVRTAGVAAVTCSDDLRLHAVSLLSVAMPAMPASMTAAQRAALAGVAVRLGALAGDFGAVGEELQVRALAADAADAPGARGAAAAGQALARSLVTTGTIVAAGGTTTQVSLRTTPAGTVATTSTGTRLTTPDALARPKDPAEADRAITPDSHESAHDRPAAGREVVANLPVGGPPAAAVQQAVAAAPIDPKVAIANLVEDQEIDPADVPAGEHRAAQTDSSPVPAPAETPAPQDPDRQSWACWMAATAAHEGLPPALPVMMALAHGGLRNMPGGESEAGFFGIDPGATYAPPGAGLGRGTRPDGEWWVEHPDAQLDHVVGRLSGLGGGIRTPDLDDPEALGRWAAEAAPGIDPSQLGAAHAAAEELVGACRQEHTVAGAPLQVAQSQLGVREIGANTGPQVDQYLASASVGSGNPWCASFVAWSLQETGHDMAGSGWAAVSTWVNAAESGQHGLQIVDAAAARPGDIVAYDWGGQADFGQDGHIGFLESDVRDGRFTTVEGNAGDAVTRMERSLGEGNVVFIRAG